MQTQRQSRAFLRLPLHPPAAELQLFKRRKHKQVVSLPLSEWKRVNMSMHINSCQADRQEKGEGIEKLLENKSIISAFITYSLFFWAVSYFPVSSEVTPSQSKTSVKTVTSQLRTDRERLYAKNTSNGNGNLGMSAMGKTRGVK